MKKMEAGKLDNLTYLVKGSSVIHINGKVGYVSSISDKLTGIDGEVSQARLTIHYPCGGGTSFHSYRHDGRSREEADYDIVRYIEPWESKVKSVSVWSDETLCFDSIAVGNEIGILAKLYIDTKKDKRTRQVKPSSKDGFKFTWRLTKKGEIRVKVWRDKELGK